MELILPPNYEKPKREFYVFEVVNPVQWSDWQEKMDALVQRQLQGLISVSTPEELYANIAETIELSLKGAKARFALIVEKETFDLAGFVNLIGEGATGENMLIVNYFVADKSFKSIEYIPVLNDYINETGRNWNCSKKAFVTTHAIKYSLRENDPVTRRAKHLGLFPQSIIYVGEIPLDKELEVLEPKQEGDGNGD